jgi:hypothetical protein
VKWRCSNYGIRIFPNTIGNEARVIIDSNGTCQAVSYPREEEICFILQGNGLLTHGEEKDCRFSLIPKNRD